MWQGPRQLGGARLLSALVALSAGSACAAAPVRPAGVHHEGGAPPAGRALVLYGTRAGSTAEVADFIGERLAGAGWSVDVEGVDAAKDLGGYQVVVIGSAIRKGRVLPEIRAFVKARAPDLRKVPVAYFVVCMALREDTAANRARADAYLTPLRSEVTPVEVGLFAGKVDYAKLDGGAKLMAKVAGLPAGDFRDWAAIGAWAEALAARLAFRPPE